MHSWYEITNDPTIIQFVKGVFLEFTQNCETTHIAARPSMFNSKEQLIVHEETYKLQKGVIKESHNEHGEFISPIFLRPKPDGSYRTILNLKTFNKFVEYHHFKMNTLASAIRIIKPADCYMASIDLKDAHYTVAIAEEHQKYIKFLLGRKLYQYTCLPNGLSSALHIFTVTQTSLCLFT